MRRSLIHIAFLICSIILGVLVLIIPYLGFAAGHPDNGIVTAMRGLWVGESEILRSVVALSRTAFPRLFWINLLLIFGLPFYGAFALYSRCLSRYVDSITGVLMTGARKTSFVFIMLSALVVICFVVDEVGLRVIGVYGRYSVFDTPCTPWLCIHTPNAAIANEMGEFTQRVVTNSEGFSDKERHEDNAGKVRVACIGDSFTEGSGTTSDSSYPAMLQRLMPDTEVMNFGIGSSDPVYGYMAMERKVLKYHPDIVTLTINGTDRNDIITRGGFERFDVNGRIHYRMAPWWEPLYKHLYTARLILRAVLQVDWATHIPISDLDMENAKADKIIEETLDRFHTLCVSHHVRCIFVFHPLKDEVIKGRMQSAPVMAYARQQGYEVVDILRGFQMLEMRADNAKQYYWVNDGHNNGAGYALFARALHSAIYDSAAK
jgi:lysophospholipase L1-like esterase